LGVAYFPYSNAITKQYFIPNIGVRDQFERNHFIDSADPDLSASETIAVKHFNDFSVDQIHWGFRSRAAPMICPRAIPPSLGGIR
jgi:hypothetical protein